MTKKISQKNKTGHNIAADYVGGDKVNALIGSIIGSNNTSNIYISSPERYKLNEKDKEKFKGFVPENKIAEFKNLIERIEFLTELGSYHEAKVFVEQANAIYHNHPVLLTLNGLSEYGILDKLEVIKYPWLMDRITKLFEKAREVDSELADYYGWNSWISSHFFSILQNNIQSIIQYNKFRIKYRNIDYYKAIAKHIIHLENCFRINEETFYLKEFVLHLCGHKNYAWFNIDSAGKVADLGRNIFDGGAEKRLNELLELIQKHEQNYCLPEIRYGDYFSRPEAKRDIDKGAWKIRTFSALLVAFAIVGIILVFNSWGIPFHIKLSILFSFLFTWAASHPFGNRLSYLQRLAKWIEAKI